MNWPWVRTKLAPLSCASLSSCAKTCGPKATMGRSGEWALI